MQDVTSAKFMEKAKYLLLENGAHHEADRWQDAVHRGTERGSETNGGVCRIVLCEVVFHVGQIRVHGMIWLPFTSWGSTEASIPTLLRQDWKVEVDPSHLWHLTQELVPFSMNLFCLFRPKSSLSRVINDSRPSTIYGENLLYPPCPILYLLI